MIKLFFTSILIFIVFIGCSSKKYYEPEDVVGSYSQDRNDLPDFIKELNKDGATLNDYRILNKKGISKYALPEGFSFLNRINNIILASNKYGKLLVKNKKNIFTFKKNVIAATIKDDLLALVFVDNSVAVYDIKLKKFKFKEYQDSSAINDHRIANPVFLDDIILFPTLSGNIIIASNESFKLVKTIALDPNSKVNNIIFLKTVGDTMVAATSNKVLTLGTNLFKIKSYSIKDIISHDKYLYIATLDGKIIKLDLTLDVLAKKKFKFAKIYALAYGTYLYALESEEYLIQLDEEFTNIKDYDFDFNADKKAIAIGNTLYLDDEYIKLK